MVPPNGLKPLGNGRPEGAASAANTGFYFSSTIKNKTVSNILHSILSGRVNFQVLHDIKYRV
jgi:hypothetical protein